MIPKENSESGEVKLKCPFCMGRYKDQQILNEHIRNAHDKSSQSQKLEVKAASSFVKSENFNEDFDKLMLEEMELDSEEDDQLLLSKYQNALKRKAENNSYYQIRKAKVLREQDQSVMSNLTIDSNKGEKTQIDEDFFKDNRIIPSKAQRVEVLTKIGAERDFLFGKLKYGVTRQKRDEYRERFLKWCRLKDIPFQTWKKVEDHYNQWKSTFKKNQGERERSGSKAQPLENWEQVLELFEVEGQILNSDKPKRTSFEIEMWGERSSIPDSEIDSNKDLTAQSQLTDLTIDSKREKETYLDKQKCSICNERFPCRKNLYAHIRKYHQQSIATLNMNCPHCADVFNSCKTLKRHHLTVHKGKVPRRPFTCTLCQKSLNSIEKLHIHTSLHKGKKPYKCNICCINFKFKHNLHSHLRKIHGNASENNPMSFELYWQEFEENINSNKLINDKDINASKVNDEENQRTSSQIEKPPNFHEERINIEIDTKQDLSNLAIDSIRGEETKIDEEQSYYKEPGVALSSVETEMWGDRSDHEFDSNKDLTDQSIISNLTINSESEKEMQGNSKEPNVILTPVQREEVLSKIIDERHFLFGKIKDGVTREMKDQYRKQFLKWCKVRGIPYKTWKKVEENWNNWKSICKANQCFREEETGLGFKPPERWELLLANYELEGQISNPDKPKRTSVETEMWNDKSDHEIDSKKDLPDISNLTSDSKKVKKEIKSNREQSNSKEPNIILTTVQREEVLSKIIDERHFLFGTIKDGVTREMKDQHRIQFLKWCKDRGIPYKTWKKVEENWRNWKSNPSICNANQHEIEEETGSGFKPPERWEQILLANCDLEGQILDPDKPRRASVEMETSDHEIDSKKVLTDISNLASDSKSEKEIKSNKEQSNSKDPNNYLTSDQREEVLSKIIDERCFLFGKLKDGVTREKRDESRKQFLKWCKDRGIPYKEWNKVGENWRNWKSICFKNQCEREKQSETGVKPPERWEQLLLANCELEGQILDPDKPKRTSVDAETWKDKFDHEIHSKISVQREEVISKIIDEKCFLFGKIKDGVTRENKDESRKQFLKWCKVRGIPYKEWKKVEENWRKWKSICFKNHDEREKQTAGVKPPERWEKLLLANCEREDSKPFECSICNQVYSSEVNLKAHIKKLHTPKKQIKTSINAMEKSKVVLDNLNEKEAERKFQNYLSKVFDPKVKEAPTIFNEPEPKLEENIYVPVETSNMTNMDINIGLVNSRNGDIMDVNLLNTNMIYSCFECPNTFDDTVKLNEHFMLMHDKKKNQQIYTEKNEEPFQKINPSVQEEENLTKSIASSFTVVEEPIERINQAIVLKYLGINSPNALDLNTDLNEQNSSNHEQKASQGFIQKITNTAFDKGELDPLDVSSDSDSKVWIF